MFMRRSTTRKLTRLIIASIVVIGLYQFINRRRDGDRNKSELDKVNKLKEQNNDNDNQQFNDQHQFESTLSSKKPQDIPKPKLIDLIEQNRNNNPDAFVMVNGEKLRVIDWHDYKKIAEDEQRHGPGEQGVGVVLDAKDANSKQQQQLLRENGFNALVSDKISLQRLLNDIRHPDCKKKTYLEKLPHVSVVIPFHDEHLSVLLRSVYSIIDRTPKELLTEIILVDDFSTKSFLKETLDQFVSANFKNDLVKIIRLSKREGLIRTRLAGAKAAKGEVLIFFDSHIEVTNNWLPPLIEPIAKDYKASVCPFIDVISDDTFAYSAQDNGARGAFNWDMLYKRLPLLQKDLEKPTEPFESPVMAGGLFAISAKWFWELEGYDDGLEIWGAEQYELSFKIWQCGGRLLDAPCSRVGHIYRKFNPFGSGGNGDYLTRNHKRVAEVWMDEYKYYYYKNQSYIMSVETGDISKQKALREKLHCKSFKWFMENVAFDLADYYPPVPPKPYAHGEIRSNAAPLCIDSAFKLEGGRIGLDKCLKGTDRVGGEQNFEITFRHDLRVFGQERCFDVSRSVNETPVFIFGCHGMRGNQEFLYEPKSLVIYHPISRQCVEANLERKEIYTMPCDKTKKTQQWLFENYNATAIEHDFKIPQL